MTIPKTWSHYNHPEILGTGKFKFKVRVNRTSRQNIFLGVFSSSLKQISVNYNSHLFAGYHPNDGNCYVNGQKIIGEEIGIVEGKTMFEVRVDTFKGTIEWWRDGEFMYIFALCPEMRKA